MLPEYDRETYAQPPGVFQCHTGDNSLCRGWLDVHDKGESLALRLAVCSGQVSGEIFNLPASGVPVFASGAEAAEHGLPDVDHVLDRATVVIEKLQAAKRLRNA